MGDATTIEWTDATWNPVRGCSIVSKGCTNCYAMRQAHRSSGAGGAYAGLTKMSKGGPVWTGNARLVPELLAQPLRWRRPRRIFVNSMSDLFHEDVPNEFIQKVWLVMALAKQHVFQILTKRPQRMLAWLTSSELDGGLDSVRWGERPEIEELEREAPWPLPNVWLGVSVEDQVAADERIPLLLQTPAAVRWISAEPLLGAVKLSDEWLKCQGGAEYGHGFNHTAVHAGCCDKHQRLHWVVAGGESGPGARPMHPEWARTLRDQCAAAGVPFFFKQWGNWYPWGTLEECKALGSGSDVLFFPGVDHCFKRYGKKASGRQLDGRTHDEYPA